MVRWVRQELTTIALVALIVTAAMVALEFWLGGWRRPQTVVFQGLPFGLLMSATISGSVTILLLLTGAIARRLHPVLRWAFWVATFVTGAVAGTFLAAVVLSVIGTVAREAILVVFRQNLLGTIPTTIVVGVFIMTVEIWKLRVKTAEAALHEQQMERERAERLASEAQLASLSARVHPHFLFNTLNAIAALVRDDPRRAEQMVEQLSGVLRASLDAATTVPLEREMKLVDDYLRIQQARFGERLHADVEWDADGLRGAAIPPFAIQTLVENAVKHVAGQRAEGIRIHVGAMRSDASLVVEVRDDGAGFEPDALKAGHGLDNLQARLRAAYGGRGRLEFDRRPDGMTVRARLPLVMYEHESVPR
jgi:signal transduction histidine kinase